MQIDDEVMEYAIKNKGDLEEIASPRLYYSTFKRNNTNKLELHHQYGSSFCIDSHYEIVDCVGQGAYGIVAAVRDKRTDEFYAVKKVSDISCGRLFAKRTLREMRILRLLHHENVYIL